MKRKQQGGWQSKTLTRGKTKIMPVLVDGNIHKQIKARASKAGLSVAEFVRRAAIHCPSKLIE